MSSRRVIGVVGLSVVPMLVLFACDGDSTSPPVKETPETGQGFETSLPDTNTSTPDTSVPPDTSTPDTSTPDAADAADAAPVTRVPFATGLGANGVALADQQVDPHWTVKDANNVALTTYVQTDALGYPGFWLAPSATSKFVSPFVDTVDPTGMGIFTFTTTFVLGPEVVLGNVRLVARYASDNQMMAIVLNGQSIGAVNGGGYGAFESVTIMTPFVAGTNTIAFTIGNSGGPTGFRAELDLTK